MHAWGNDMAAQIGKSGGRAVGSRADCNLKKKICIIQ